MPFIDTPETNALKSKVEKLLSEIPNFTDENKNLKINVIKDYADNGNVSSAYISEIENQKKIGKFETIAAIANALGVEPYELFLPAGSVISHNERRTKDLMKRLRANFSELVDTMEDFLKD